MKCLYLILYFILISDLYSQQDSLTLKYNFIDSYPQNAEIKLNGEFLGSTPFYFTWKDTIFPKQLKLNLPGFNEINEDVLSNEIINKTYKLNPSGKYIVNNLVNENKGSYFKVKRKPLPIILSSLITAGSGFFAYYFKSLANENAKEYDISGDKTAIDRKKKYDLIGGISIAVMQVGFGALIYFLFIE
ncbi:MAG: PEGA domain-containing protein [Ignavibacteria bacterium]|nr:PEGA domain-containing protein [Ignavibacteria bacterium]